MTISTASRLFRFAFWMVEEKKDCFSCRGAGCSACRYPMRVSFCQLTWRVAFFGTVVVVFSPLWVPVWIGMKIHEHLDTPEKQARREAEAQRERSRRVARDQRWLAGGGLFYRVCPIKVEVVETEDGAATV